MRKPKAPKTEHLVSAGRLCEQFQEGPWPIGNCLRLAGVEPRFTLNGVAYYDEAAAVKALVEARVPKRR